MSHHHHHGHNRYEDEQIDSDERMAARLQAEENQRAPGGYPGQGQQYQGQGFQGQQHQGQQYQGQQYQGNPQSGGYQGQAPQGFMGGQQQGQQFGGPPPHYGPPLGQQQQGGYGRPPQGPPQGQGGYNYSNPGPQPEFQGNQFQGQTHYQGIFYCYSKLSQYILIIYTKSLLSFPSQLRPAAKKCSRDFHRRTTSNSSTSRYKNITASSPEVSADRHQLCRHKERPPRLSPRCRKCEAIPRLQRL